MSAPNIPSSAQRGKPSAIPGSSPAPVPGPNRSGNTKTSAPHQEQSTAQSPQLISVQTPTGGGAIQGIGEKFAAQPATGTATLTIPISATEARPGGTPSLALGYSSGSGNAPFGIGWSLNIGSITRRVSKGRPQYQPRSEGTFARIERVTHQDGPGNVHWRVTSRDNALSAYGRNSSSRIHFASKGNKNIFSWLLCETYDVSGNAISFVYKSEDDQGIDLNAVNERNHAILRGSVGSYFSRALPPLDFDYIAAATGERIARSVVKEVDWESLENLPEGVTGPLYQWLDLHEEGLEAVFAVQGGSWFYKRNQSAAGTVSSLENSTLSRTVTLEPTKVVNRMPNVSDTEKPRFGQWDVFPPFELWPSGIDIGNPNVRFIDLTGDGRADILITEDQILTYHVSLGYSGYGAPRSVHKRTDEERGPRVLFSDVDESVYFTNLSGDGTSDLCRVRNGENCYWPNLGCGRFGVKVTMNGSPYFDRPEAFTQKRVLMTDINGSGATDIIYVRSEGVTLHFNNSGNGWAKVEHLPSYFLPPIDTLASITATNLMGNGTNCLVWSSSAASDTCSPLKYINFNNGIKPHLHVKITNNIGKETNLSYLPSTTFYLRDELEGKHS
ncbi:hypothetical protein DL767_007311 [Monosporascus sp. MG133]|nr:hypothetical protein DL767_007311 [Monosporascus sp. MG133]